MVMFDYLINQESDKVYLVEGDRKMLMFHEKTAICVDTLDFFDDCLTAYGNDLLDGMIPVDYYQTATTKVREEIKKVRVTNNLDVTRVNIEFSDKMFVLGNELMFKRKFTEAAQVFHLGIQLNPISPASYDSLGKAYKNLGNHDLAMKYSRKSKEVFEFPDRFLK
jgi:tetratricopeptide (TPR) repeat protein